jgi:hypothetical protein
MMRHVMATMYYVIFCNHLECERVVHARAEQNRRQLQSLTDRRGGRRLAHHRTLISVGSCAALES